MLSVWTVASRIVKNTLKVKQVPMLAIGAAFSFVIMMFNILIPCGSTGHAGRRGVSGNTLRASGGLYRDNRCFSSAGVTVW